MSSGVNSAGSNSTAMAMASALGKGTEAFLKTSKEDTKKKTDIENRNVTISSTDTTQIGGKAFQSAQAAFRTYTASLPTSKPPGDLTGSMTKLEQSSVFSSRSNFSIRDLVGKVLALLNDQAKFKGEMMKTQADFNMLTYKAGMAAADSAFKAAQKDAIGMFVNAGMSAAGGVMSLGGSIFAMRRANAAVKQLDTPTPKAKNPADTSATGTKKTADSDSNNTTRKNQDAGGIDARRSTRNMEGVNSKTKADTENLSRQSTRETQQTQETGKRSSQSVQDQQSQAIDKQKASQKSSEILQETGVKKAKTTDNLEQPKNQPLELSQDQQKPRAKTTDDAKPVEPRRESAQINEDYFKKPDPSELTPTKTSEPTKTFSNGEKAQLFEQAYQRNNTFGAVGQSFAQAGGQIGMGAAKLSAAGDTREQMQQTALKDLTSSTANTLQQASQKFDENIGAVRSMVSAWLSALQQMSKA
jgi:hypothetical protein